MNFDQIYADFTSKFLPLAEKGISLSKDYVMDIFGRYVTYMIISDSMLVIVLSLAIGFLIFYIKKPRDEECSYYDDDANIMLIWVFLVFCSVGNLIAIDHLVKDIFVPEVKIFEQIKK